MCRGGVISMLSLTSIAMLILRSHTPLRKPRQTRKIKLYVKKTNQNP